MPILPLLPVREQVLKDFINQNPKLKKSLKNTVKTLKKDTLYETNDAEPLLSRLTDLKPMKTILGKIKQDLVNIWYILNKT